MAAQTGLGAATLALECSTVIYPAIVTNTPGSLVDQGDAYLAWTSRVMYESRDIMLHEEMKPLKLKLKKLTDESTRFERKKVTWQQNIPFTPHNIQARKYRNRCKKLARLFAKTSTTAHCRLLNLDTISSDNISHRRHSTGHPFEDPNISTTSLDAGNTEPEPSSSQDGGTVLGVLG